MHAGLARLITDFQTAVKRAVELMQASGIPLPRSTIEWVITKIPQKGRLNGGIRYFKHGFGCHVELPNGVIDFDFGSHGEINGFDIWRLRRFAGSRLAEYDLVDEKALETEFNAAVELGTLLRSGALYYLASDRTEALEALSVSPYEDLVQNPKGDFKIDPAKHSRSKARLITPFLIGGILLLCFSLYQLISYLIS